MQWAKQGLGKMLPNLRISESRGWHTQSPPPKKKQLKYLSIWSTTRTLHSTLLKCIYNFFFNSVQWFKSKFSKFLVAEAKPKVLAGCGDVGGSDVSLPGHPLYCTAIYCTALRCTALHFNILHCTAVYCTVIYCNPQHCTALYYTALYCTVIYCTIL